MSVQFVIGKVWLATEDWLILFHVPRTACDVIIKNGQGRLCHLTSNPTTVKAFPKTFPTEMKPRKFPAKEKNGTRKAKVQGKEENEKPILKPKAYFLRMPKLWNLIFCIWKRRREVLDLSTRFWDFVALTCNGQRERYGFVL